jgi:formylglycine-generating enzyme required for sulfatase activity
MATSENPQPDLQLPADFPYWWCSDYGEDEYGIFMGFTFQGIRQGFRWIPPGTFMMGSPKDEAGRYDDETLHQVTLTQGYWLAETTCTQALWQAVMGENPSEFKGDDRPVEKVSWEDSQSFLRKLNAWQPELGLRLPTEAEWEYGCRAGTQTAFWFGDRIDPERVHFGKGSGTLPAKALEPNPWGFYQMHGNVREWCQDWLSTYPSSAVSDPQGPDSGQYRVLRGGSWHDEGRYCRSADRYGLTPDLRYDVSGFRLARGQKV